MNKQESFINNMLAVLLTALGWCLVAVCDESRNPAECACVGLFCLAVASFILGYVNGRR